MECTLIETDEIPRKNAVDYFCACGVEFTGREQKEQKERDGRLGQSLSLRRLTRH